MAVSKSLITGALEEGGQVADRSYDIEDLKVKFDGYKGVPGVNGQLFQDLWVLQMLDGKREGVYVEIGAADPVYMSNTKLLEELFGWRGIGVELDEERCQNCQVRVNPVIHADATEVDYRKELTDRGLPLKIDYLSVDCEPASVTFAALKKVLEGGIEPALITFEHEFYAEGEAVRNEAREYLKGKGYHLIAGNVGIGAMSFEDWYAHESRVPIARLFVCSSLEESNDAGVLLFGR